MKDKKYTVEINSYGRPEKISASGYMLNLIAIAFGEAAERYRSLGSVALEKEARDAATDIDIVLTKAGYYNN